MLELIRGLAIIVGNLLLVGAIIWLGVTTVRGERSTSPHSAGSSLC